MADHPPPTIGHDLVAQLNISKPVGDIPVNGTSPNANMFDDILIVQYLLNRSPGPGKPNPPLPEDGALPTPQFIAAIRDYESSRGPVDGRIDPGDATMTALNGVPLGEFEGITDFLERRSVILRINRAWNFTRGDFKTLTDVRGLSLRYDPSTTWLPDLLKTRILTLLNTVLKPAQVPSSTWGVSTLDSYHWHLGLWSGVVNKPISAASEAWVTSSNEFVKELVKVREPFFKNSLKTSFPGDIPGYRAAHAAWLQTPGVALRLNAYAKLPESVIVHHTFEGKAWRPDMLTEDPRRHWMVDERGAIQTPPYRSHVDLNAAGELPRREFLCEGMLQINLLIDRSGVIHPILGLLQDLSVVTGLPSDALFPPKSIFDTEKAPF